MTSFCEAIVAEMEGRKDRSTEHIIKQMQDIIHKHFAALSVEEIAKAIADARGHGMREKEMIAAQAVMQLLRKG